MVRTPTYRMPVSEDVLVLKGMCEVLLGQRESNDCTVCHKPSDFYCHCCGLCWHHGCAAQALNTIDDPGADLAGMVSNL